MKDRIKKLRKELDLTQQEFADRIGVKRGGIANYEIGRNEPADSVISLICREFNVNKNWLREGVGDIFIEQTMDEQIASFIGRVQMDSEDSFQKRLLSALAELNEDQWNLLSGIIQKLTK
ncbi:MAG: helix-turn-helix transcriptional regulator [Lachnospiraceae bacterium]|nr:helix-turn-helix transcriptional regulator [Lachnospiraceae bacterium]